MLIPRMRSGLLVPVLAAVLCPAFAEDWPTYQHDNRRSGITSEQLTFPLQEAWRHTARQAPQPAWPPPAPIDFVSKTGQILHPRVTYDRAFHAGFPAGHGQTNLALPLGPRAALDTNSETLDILEPYLA